MLSKIRKHLRRDARNLRAEFELVRPRFPQLSITLGVSAVVGAFFFLGPRQIFPDLFLPPWLYSVTAFLTCMVFGVPLALKPILLEKQREYNEKMRDEWEAIRELAPRSEDYELMQQLLRHPVASRYLMFSVSFMIWSAWVVLEDEIEVWKAKRLLRRAGQISRGETRA